MPHRPIIQYVYLSPVRREAHANIRFSVLLGVLEHGACVIQPTVISFSSAELVDMVARCGLNRLRQFAAFLAMQIRAAQKDPKLLALLVGLDEVLFTGMPLPRDEEDWAYGNDIPLKVCAILPCPPSF